MKKLMIFTCLMICSCNENSKRLNRNIDSLETKTTANHNIDSLEQIIKKSEDINNYIVDSKTCLCDYLIIKDTCGIFVYPDSIEVNKMINDFGENGFYVSQDDNLYYDYLAGKFLDSMHVKTLKPQNRYLKFIVNNDTICIDTKSKYKRGWLEILYKTNEMPKIFDPVEIEKEYSDYLE